MTDRLVINELELMRDCSNLRYLSKESEKKIMETMGKVCRSLSRD